MTKAHPTLTLQGDAFSPAEAARRTGLPLVEAEVPGQLRTRGRYKGQPIPYGAATLETPEYVPEEDKLDWLLDVALPHVEVLRELGASTIRVYVSYAYDTQCNLAFTPAELEKLARLGVAFCVSCYQDASQFEDEPPSPVAG